MFRELAPARFAQWMSTHRHVDRLYGHTYRYHPRSDAHSIALCKEVLKDMLDAIPLLKEQASRGEVIYGINITVTAPTSGKEKTLDLALGTPSTLAEPSDGLIAAGAIQDLLFSCEAKSVMTEHGKSKPRVWDELSSSHEIVHQGWPKAIAAGLTVVNMASTYVSPTRQKSRKTLHMTKHKQPAAGEGMIRHLRGLRVRESLSEVGFDAYATIVIDCDNQSDQVNLCSAAPAPLPEGPDSYETFLRRISRQYPERFSNLPTP